jgi:hypothetical protein
MFVLFHYDTRVNWKFVFLHIPTLSETPSASMSEGFKGCRSLFSEVGQNVL